MTGPGGLSAADFARWYRDRALEQWSSLDIAAIARLADCLVRVEKERRTVWVIGNGGSAATSWHISTDFAKTASRPGRPQLRCLSLTDNVAFITAIANDLSFDDIFSRQLENVLVKGDLLLIVSGSGNSPNLLKAAALAKARGARTAALLGFDGGALKRRVDIPILVSSDQYGVIEDMHVAIDHILAFFLRQRK